MTGESFRNAINGTVE